MPRSPAIRSFSKPKRPAAADLAEPAVDTSYLESLVGYNARRAALHIIALFIERMAVYALRPVEFSVISLIGRNPGITSRQLCSALGLLPPNLVVIVNMLEKRGLITRQPHPSDGRATGLHATAAGKTLVLEATAKLTAAERNTLMRLLKKVYL